MPRKAKETPVTEPDVKVESEVEDSVHGLDNAVTSESVLASLETMTSTVTAEAEPLEALEKEDSVADNEIAVNTPAPPERKSFYDLNFRKLDKDLSPDEQKEWSAIYASYRAGSILSGRVAGVDAVKLEAASVDCLVVFDYRVKVLIPSTEVWSAETSERPSHILHSLLGAEVDYIVKEVDREGYCVVASRKQAMNHRRKSFRKRMPKAGDLVDCRVLAVSQNKLLLECGGYEATLSQNSISYGMILDLRETYRPGQAVKAVFKGLDGDIIQLSVKEVNPHPFDGIERRHPLHHRRLSRIVGKYAGGVFCELEKGFSCMCLYSPEQMDCDFDLGDNVIVVVTKHDFANKLVYGRIVTSW